MNFPNLKSPEELSLEQRAQSVECPGVEDSNRRTGRPQRLEHLPRDLNLYLDRVLRASNLVEAEAHEVRDELAIHLAELLASWQSQGLTEVVAVQQSIEDFGDPVSVGQAIGQARRSRRQAGQLTRGLQPAEDGASLPIPLAWRRPTARAAGLGPTRWATRHRLTVHWSTGGWSTGLRGLGRWISRGLNSYGSLRWTAHVGPGMAAGLLMTALLWPTLPPTEGDAPPLRVASRPDTAETAGGEMSPDSPPPAVGLSCQSGSGEDGMALAMASADGRRPSTASSRSGEAGAGTSRRQGVAASQAVDAGVWGPSAVNPRAIGETAPRVGTGRDAASDPDRLIRLAGHCPQTWKQQDPCDDHQRTTPGASRGSWAGQLLQMTLRILVRLREASGL